LYGPLIEQALADWGDYRLRLALDTSQLWGQYCLVRIAVIYRGRAVLGLINALTRTAQRGVKW